MKKKMTVGRGLLYAVLIVYAVITLYPFLWMVAASFKPLREIVGGNMALISENMTLDNYATIFGHSSLFPRCSSTRCSCRWWAPSSTSTSTRWRATPSAG